MDEPVCFGCRDALKRITELAGKLEKAALASKRQVPSQPASPIPGYKFCSLHGASEHRPIPTRTVAECHQAHCSLIETKDAKLFQTELSNHSPIRKFTVHLGRRTDCGAFTHRRQSTLDLPHAGLSHAKMATVFEPLFGTALTRGAVR